ncbi:multidrug effflux MFS transporter [Vibrio sp. SCSIO 43136]|uniref:multidrug effflux MFS transporter n=1 Tax=Vibrio sp. SCSIO 43136 TaxID=2819101 RepID=UPI002075D9F2|nr:multidrug effflux MFS transporter [Vibrio sp. SCSIO 43136]USD67636.1 multidrug effflux MFS transporter [Vibrio sp. SCSIO 43136]
MNKYQPHLGNRGTLFFLVIISAFPPLTTDLYLPALPQMVDIFDTSQAKVNLTLSVYFVTYAFGLLFWGPLSEKFGRKPIMLTGIGLYIVASLLCAAALTIDMLIGARLLQAFGGSAVTVVATAVVKDMFDGRQREKIMSTIISLVIIAPMIAPVIGALLLKFTSWRMMFVALAVFGLFAGVLGCLYKETLGERYQGTIARSWTRLGVVLQNRRFVALLSIFSITPMALMAFLAAGSYIYVDGFGLTEQQFSYAFAFNALFASLGPTLYMKLSNRISIRHIVSLFYTLLIGCGVLTLFLGHTHWWLFGLISAPATLVVVATRIPGTNLMLEQQDQDTGSAVALIQFFGMICGSIGMLLVSVIGEDLIHNLGLIQFIIGIIGFTLWQLVRNKPFVVNKLPHPKQT